VKLTLRKLAIYGGYDALNGDVHRQPASIIGQPCLTRHIGFTEVAKRSETDIADAVRSYLQDLRATLDDQAAHYIAAQFEREINGSGRGRAVRIEFDWRGIAIALRIEIHTENIAFTAFLDLSLKRGFGPGKVAANQDFDSLADRLKDDLAKFSRLLAHKDKGLSAMREEFYETIWKEEIFDKLLDRNSILGERFGEVFCDFRGLVVGHGEHDNAHATCPLAPPYRTDRHLRGQDYSHEKQNEAWARNIVECVWPLLCDENADAELTVSRFLDGGAVYASALGDPWAPAAAEDWIPIRYYLHFWTSDPFQIGRLVDRLHFLGMLRLSALFQINELQQLNFGLDRFERDVAELRQLVPVAMPGGRHHLADTAMGRSPPAQSSPATESPPSNEEMLHRLRTLIASGSEIERHSDGALPARVERSMYYINKFNTDVKALRIRRLEGYQPYDEFVFRRLGGSFLFIEMIGERLTQHARNMQTLAGYVTALSMTGVMDRTRSLTESNFHLAHKMRELNEEIDDIQDIGEIVLFAVIAPHYFSEAILGIAKHVFKENTPIAGMFDTSSLMFAVTVGVVITSARLFLGVVNRYEAEQEEKAEAAQGANGDHALAVSTPVDPEGGGHDVAVQAGQAHGFRDLPRWTRERWKLFGEWRKDPDTKPAKRMAFYIKCYIVLGVWLLAFFSFVAALCYSPHPIEGFGPWNAEAAGERSAGREPEHREGSPPQHNSAPPQSQGLQVQIDLQTSDSPPGRGKRPVSKP